MRNSNTLIILDWDDTLFPTTWILQKKINLNCEKTKNKHMVFFSQLDNILYKLLNTFMERGTVMVVTNAMVKWVMISADIIPNTKRLIEKNIEIISAREKHQDDLPNDAYAWKRLIFKDIVSKFYANTRYQNIISVGDAEYEFKALIHLWNKKRKKRILKTVRFIQSPSFESLIDQLEVLSASIDKICNSKTHMDLKFDNH